VTHVPPRYGAPECGCDPNSKRISTMELIISPSMTDQTSAQDDPFEKEIVLEHELVDGPRKLRVAILVLIIDVILLISFLIFLFDISLLFRLITIVFVFPPGFITELLRSN